MERTFRLLRADEIECRIAQIFEKNGEPSGVSLLLYKTARTDADLLDETVGSGRWENDFKLIDGVLYGGLGVNYGDGLVWKWDAGTESNTEAEKGRASDAFKRAGFKHGIGRELYSAPFIFIAAADCNIKKDAKGKLRCADRFEVKEIGYTENRITFLEIGLKGKIVYRMGTQKEKPVICEVCGEEIQPYKSGKRVFSPQEIFMESFNKYHKGMCIECGKAAASENAG